MGVALEPVVCRAGDGSAREVEQVLDSERRLFGPRDLELELRGLTLQRSDACPVVALLESAIKDVGVDQPLPPRLDVLEPRLGSGDAIGALAGDGPELLDDQVPKRGEPLGRRLQLAKDGNERALEGLAAHVDGAAVVAAVVGVTLPLATRPGAGEGTGARRATGEAATQRELDVAAPVRSHLACLGGGPRIELALHSRPGGRVDELLVGRLAVDAPAGHEKLALVEGVAQDAVERLLCEAIAARAEETSRLEVRGYVGYPRTERDRAEGAGDELGRLGVGFDAHVAAAQWVVLCAIAERRLPAPAAGLERCAHPALGVAALDLVFELSDAGEDGLDEVALGRVIAHHCLGHRAQEDGRAAEDRTERVVVAGLASQPIDRIDEEDVD